MATVLTTVGKGIVTNRIKGSGTEPNYVAIGTGTTTAGVADTSIQTEVETRVAGTSSQVTTTVTNDTYQVVGTITATASRAVGNAGLLDAVSSGNLFVHGNFATLNLETSDSIQFTIKISFS